MKQRAAFILPAMLGIVLTAATARAQFSGSLLPVAAGAQTPASQPTPKAQPTPSPTPRPEDTQPSTPAGTGGGDYTVVSGIELGLRAVAVDGSRDKYGSDLNYGAGFRLFDSSFLVRAGDGDGPFFDTLVVNSSGFNADPHGSFRANVENGRWYRLDFNYRRNRYDNRLRNLALGEHFSNTAHNFGDFDLRVLPTNRRVRFNLGYSFDRNRGAGGSTYDYARDEFAVENRLRTRADEYRGGAEGRAGPLDLGFLVGTRRYRDDTTYFIEGVNPGTAARPSVLSTFEREQPTRGRAWFTRLSAHANAAEAVDLIARYTYSKARTRFSTSEVLTGRDASNNVIERDASQFGGATERPSHLFEFGLTWQPTKRLRVSDTYRYNKFTNEGDHVYSDVLFLRRATGAPVLPFPTVTTVPVERMLEYRRAHNQLKLDYQAGPRFGFHLGHRISDRRIVIDGTGRLLPAPASAAATFEEQTDTQNNSFFGGFKARPVKPWTLYFDFERGEADNTLTRVDNLDQISFRVRSRVTPRRNLGISLVFSSRDNSDPGVGVRDQTLFGNLDSTPFSVNIDSRVFSTTLDWTPGARYSFNAGYTYTHLESDAEILYFRANVRLAGRSLSFVRDQFFFFNASARLLPRLSAYAGYRVHSDRGQGDRLTDDLGGTFIRSLPYRLQSPEARLIFRVNRRLDWNVGYQYFEYKERFSDAQNYRAHLPYTSLRFYFGGGEQR